MDDRARDSDEDDDEEDINGSSVQVSNVTSMPGSSAKNRLAAAIDDIVGKYQEKPRHSSRGRLPYKAAWSPGTVEKRMYLLLVHSTPISNPVSCHSLRYRNCYPIYRRTPSKQRVFCYCIDLGARPTLRGLG